MMQVSTLYAHSLDRQFVTKRSQLMRSFSDEQPPPEQDDQTEQTEQQPPEEEQEQEQEQQPLPDSPTESVEEQSLAYLSEPELPGADSDTDSESPQRCTNNLNQFNDLVHNNNDTNTNLNSSSPTHVRRNSETDAKEFTDRLCKLPSQCRGSYILGSPRRHNSSMSTSSSRLCQSAGQLNLSSNASLVKSHNGKKSAMSSSDSKSVSASDKKGKKGKGKDKKEAKKLPSNFMHLGTWSTRQNCEKLLEQVKSGDVLEFNIKFHHHWGIALVNKNKKPTLENLELIHLKKDKDGSQKAVKQTLAEYWTEGVTARINNSRDVHKQPLCAADVISTSLKLVAQPYRIWQNSEQLITHCRYGEGVRSRQMSDAARWGTLSKCVGLWLTLTSSSRASSPASSPKVRRKRTMSVNF